MTDEARSNNRNQHIDALRGLSILVVLSLHYCSFLPTGFTWIPTNVFTLVARNGYYGVTAFFTISGFLIMARTLQRNGLVGAIEPREFYRARFARIYPLLFTLTILFIVLSYLRVSYFIPPIGINIWSTAWKALTFQFTSASTFVPWAPLWSLTIEEGFYLLFPVACIVLHRNAVLAGAFIALIVQALQTRYQPADLYYFSACADAIAMGCLAAMLSMRLPRSVPLGLLLMGGGFAILMARYFSAVVTDDVRFGPTVVAFGAAMFLAGASLVKTTARGYLGPIALLGRRSYEIYLLHMPLLAIAKLLFGEIASGSPDLTYVAFIVMAGAVGEFIGRRFTDPLYRRITGAPSREAPALIQVYAT